MKYTTFFKGIVGTLVVLCFFACDPRVELDRGQWGERDDIQGVALFKSQEVTNKLNYSEPVTGKQFIAVGGRFRASNDTAFFVADAGTDLTKVLIKVSISADRMAPLDGSPQPGLIADFSKGEFKYRLYSADGKTKDWTVLISVTP